MKYEIGFQGAFPLIRVALNTGESAKFEQGAMVYNNGKVEVKAKTNGGILKGITKSMFANEDMFIGNAKATADDAILSLAPKGMGDVYPIEVGSKQWYLSDGSFLASDATVDFHVTVQKNLGGIFFGKTGGLLIIKTSGTGTMLLNALGAIEEIELNNEEFNIDNGHVLGWEESLQYSIKMSGGLGGSLLSGEGLVMNFRGTGKILVQTRKAEGLASLVVPFMEKNEAIPERKGPLGGAMNNNNNNRPRDNQPQGGGGLFGNKGGRNRGGFRGR